MTKLKKNEKTIKIFLLAVTILLTASLIAATVSVIRNKNYYYNALSQSVGASSVLLSKPGEIYDANGNVIASLKRVYRLVLDPAVMTEMEKRYKGTIEKTAELLAAAFSLDASDIVKTVKENETSAYLRYQSAIVSEEAYLLYQSSVTAYVDYRTKYNKTAADNGESDRITAHIAGVQFEEEYRRIYPLGSTFSKVVGYASKDSSVGVTGLEYYYNDILHGTNGRRVTYIDTEGNLQTEVSAAVDGYSLVTSLDENVSRIVQECIQDFMEEVGAGRVNVLVMRPKTGEILCMESDTEFDLNNPSDLSALFTEEELEHPEDTFLLQETYRTEKQKEKLASMTLDEKKTVLRQLVQSNYAVSSSFEPGSTAKTLTLAAGLEESVISKDDTFNCQGEIDVEDYTIHCHMDSVCGDLQPIEALGRSCNVCFVQIAEAIGAQKFAKYQDIFNIGQKTGIDLPGEADTSRLYYAEESLGEIELATCAFGQSFNVTMVQMAAAYASLVNGGYYYQPHVVTCIKDSSGNIVKEITPTLVRNTVSEETSEYIRECLDYVVTYGTAVSAASIGYSMGGKTGAAEKLPRGTGKYVISFIGAAPLDDPEFLVYTVIDEPNVEDQSSSYQAQVLSKNIFKALYSYFGVYSVRDDDAYSYDWSRLRDSSKDSDAAKGASFFEDPNGLMEWLQENETGEADVNPEE